MPSERRRAGFIGAALMDPALKDRFDCDISDVGVVNNDPIGTDCVETVMTRLSVPRFRGRSEDLSERFVDLGDDIRDARVMSLCSHRALVNTEGRIF